MLRACVSLPGHVKNCDAKDCDAAPAKALSCRCLIDALWNGP
jgi:hypothetical protein